MKKEVTYIKKGIQKTIVLNKLNKWKVFLDIFEIEKPWNTDKKYSIKKDIEWLQMKNIEFKNHEVINCRNNETVCIFENCKFIANDCYYLTFENGIYQLLNCRFGIKTEQIYSIDASDIEFRFKDYQSSHLKNWLKLELNSKRIKITEDKCCDKIVAYASDKIEIDGIFNLTECALFGPKIDIGNKEKRTTIRSLDFSKKLIISGKELNLDNCTIVQESEKGIEISAEKINGYDFKLKSKGNIKINGTVYKKKAENEWVVITWKDFYKMKSKAELISFLKILKKKTTQEIEEKTSDYSKEYLQEIEEQKKYLEDLKTHQLERERKIIKSLTKKSINKLKIN